MADNKQLQLKRNANIINDKGTALNGLEAQLKSNSSKVGEPMLAIYNESGKEYILLGIKGNTGYQIFEGASITNGKIDIPQSVQDAIDKTIEDMQGETEWDSFDDIKDAIDAVVGTIEALDVTDNADDTKYVSAVSQVDGKITVTRQNILSEKENNVLEIDNGSLYLNGSFDFGTY